MPNSYASLGELKSLLGVADADADNDADFERALNAAAAWIDTYCNRRFSVDAADVTKYFYTNDVELLEIEDLQTITTLHVDSHGDRTYSTSLAATDYELLPLDGPPYQQVKIWPTSSKSFSSGRRVRIVGKFGYSPTRAEGDALRLANLLLATRWYKRPKDAPYAVLQAPELGAFERIGKNDPDVLRLLEPLVRQSGAVGSWVMV
jgi:hypothetical protein